MPKIQLLDNSTIDKIAAGEVVEKPASVVKELVENAIDAKADAITIEIKEGGISLIRVTDNGSGIEESQVRDAFLRHATSKITCLEDLHKIYSLGFRGEALSSISAVSQVEIMTKTRESLMGVRLCLEGGVEKEYTSAGVPDGTTVIVKNLFLNTPARKKFLKTPVTEGGYIADLCEHLALCNPEISFRFISNGQVKFNTSGKGDVKEVIYRIFGRDFIQELIPIDVKGEGIHITGFLGKPSLNRSNRNYENCFVNGRYVKSSYLFKAVEEGYKPYLMQHKFPFTVLYFNIDTSKVDINVHPTKMDIRVTDSIFFHDFIATAIGNTLKSYEMIPSMESVNLSNKKPVPVSENRNLSPEPFEEKRRLGQPTVLEEKSAVYVTDNNISFDNNIRQCNDGLKISIHPENINPSQDKILSKSDILNDDILKTSISKQDNCVPSGENTDIIEDNKQLNLFEDKILTAKHKDKFIILGQIFNTYWLINYEEKLLFVDQHSAHEKVKFEAMMKQYKENSVASQMITPPFILHLTQRERSILEEYSKYFEKLGFQWEDFGQGAIAMREIPLDLYGKNEKILFKEILDEIVEIGCKGTPEVIQEKIISMSCKAAVKGNQSLSKEAMAALLEQLFTLENPYHCPHGRPTIISMTKTELEKKFKRIL